MYLKLASLTFNYELLHLMRAQSIPHSCFLIEIAHKTSKEYRAAQLPRRIYRQQLLRC